MAIIGGGIVGVSTARALLSAHRIDLVLLEAEDRLAAHQSGHNSGVIHAGLYYRPGSQKARLCAEGREAMYAYCLERGIAHERCGKLILATSEAELPALNELQRRGEANGIGGIERLTPEQIVEHEPHAVGIAGLHVPVTGIVDYAAVTRAMAKDVQDLGGAIRTGGRVISAERDGDGFVLQTFGGEVRVSGLINCAGLHADRLARMCGVDPQCRIIPFRGEYFRLAAARASLVRNLIYPVPDPRFPFLGVHLTRMIGGGVEAGPNAVLALARHGYSKWSVRPADAWETLCYPGFRRLARTYWRTGAAEMWRSFSKAAFARSLQRLVPALRSSDLQPGGAGVRAQAVDPNGSLVDDFRIIDLPGMVHVINAPSPAATASLAIGRLIAERAAQRMGLERNKKATG